MGKFRLATPEFTTHFTWEEVEHTNHRLIDNTLPDDLEINAWTAAKNMEIVRSMLNRKQPVPIIVSSWYRCPELNKEIGSKDTSFHLLGSAVDFIAPAFGRPQDIVAYLMQYPEETKYDQLIFERTWVHIGWDPSGKYRSQVLTLNHDGSYSNGLVA